MEKEVQTEVPMNLQALTGETPTGTGKLKRGALLHYVDASFGSGTEDWFRIGKDIDDMSVDLSPDTETKTNIWDETTVTDNGYEPKISADPYYANTGDSIYPKLKDIAMNRKTGDDCKTKYLEVIIDRTGTTFDAWLEDCIVKPQSYGGDKAGVKIPFDILPNGNRVQGTVTITDKVPKFTATTT